MSANFDYIGETIYVRLDSQHKVFGIVEIDGNKIESVKIIGGE